jgi:DNA-binding MarR family transcriptional regulator
MKTQTQEQIKLTHEAVETELEFKVLTCLINSLYAEPGFSDYGVSDLAAELKMKVNTVKGVVGSLCKKQIVYTDRDFDVVVLNRGYWFLHPEWCDEVESVKK